MSSTGDDWDNILGIAGGMGQSAGGCAMSTGGTEERSVLVPYAVDNGIWITAPMMTAEASRYGRIEVTRTVSGHQVLITFGGATYRVSMADLVTAVVEREAGR